MPAHCFQCPCNVAIDVCHFKSQFINLKREKVGFCRSILSRLNFEVSMTLQLAVLSSLNLVWMTISQNDRLLRDLHAIHKAFIVRAEAETDNMRLNWLPERILLQGLVLPAQSLPCSLVNQTELTTPPFLTTLTELNTLRTLTCARRFRDDELVCRRSRWPDYHGSITPQPRPSIRGDCDRPAGDANTSISPRSQFDRVVATRTCPQR